MTFPVFIPFGPWQLHPHSVFELLAYTIGSQIYWWQRKRHGDVVSGQTRWSVVVAAAIGGAIGSRALGLGGKTIVGGLIGGLLAVEWTKRRIGVTARTGDLFALPLAIGIAVGRVGCFLTGLDDGTFGIPTTSWMGVDFGDGIPRHPTQLYEIAFLATLASVLAAEPAAFGRTGDRFRLFMVAYLAFRFVIDALKPDARLALGLSSIQWACAGMLLYYLPDIRRWLIPASQTSPQPNR